MSKRIVQDDNALDIIAAWMSDAEWDVNLIDVIASVVQLTGRDISPVG